MKHDDVEKICKYCSNKFFVHWNKRNQQCCSKICSTKLRGGWNIARSNITKEEWSEINKKSYANGHNYVAGGTTKWYNYKGIKVQGTYELRTCKILDWWKEKGNIKDWEYTNDRIQYIGEDGKKHSYLLDFKVIKHDGFEYYIEVKGYDKHNDILKWNAVNKKGWKLEIWHEMDIIEKEMQKCED